MARRAARARALYASSAVAVETSRRRPVPSRLSLARRTSFRGERRQIRDTQPAPPRLCLRVPPARIRRDAAWHGRARGRMDFRHDFAADPEFLKLLERREDVDLT